MPIFCNKLMSNSTLALASVELDDLWACATLGGYDASTCQNDRRHAKRVVPVDMPNKIVSVHMQKNVPVDMPKKIVSVDMPKECPSMCQNDGVRQHAKNLCPSTCQSKLRVVPVKVKLHEAGQSSK